MTPYPTFISTLSAWTFEPSTVLAAAVPSLIYALGLREMIRRGRLGQRVKPYHAALFYLGILLLILALMSPLDTLDGRSFAVHMTQHLLLLEVAPLILLLGNPVPVMLMGLPRPFVRRLTRWVVRTPAVSGAVHFLTQPVVVWLAYCGIMLVWHLPPVYDATLTYPGLHLAEHALFFLSGLLFWWVVVEPLPGPTRLHAGVRLVYVFAITLPMGLLASLLTLTNGLWYPYYATIPPILSFSPIADQQLGGLIMWLPGSVLYLTVDVVLFFRMFDEDERAPEEADLPIDQRAIES
jgi:cytochrome c oxidase assembly factor CtaG